MSPAHIPGSVPLPAEPAAYSPAATEICADGDDLPWLGYEAAFPASWMQAGEEPHVAT